MGNQKKIFPYASLDGPFDYASATHINTCIDFVRRICRLRLVSSCSGSKNMNEKVCRLNGFLGFFIFCAVQYRHSGTAHAISLNDLHIVSYI